MIDLQGERITIEYIPLDDAVLWDANPKTHDIGSLCESIVRYGFVDPPKFDAQLGAFVYGNGRTVALRMMRDQGKEPPRGILHDDSGQWYIPVKFGIDQASRDVAQALAVDHNNLTMLGGEFAVWDVAKMWDESYPDLLRLLAEAEALPVSIDGDDLDALLKEFDADDGGDAPEAQVDRAAELQEKWGVKLGDVWEIPSGTVEGRCHRLMCGDSTSAEDVARLMGGNKATFTFTDPPYNVGIAYGGATNDARSKSDFISWCEGWTKFLPKSMLLTVGIKRLCWWNEIIGDPQWIIAWIKRNGQGQTALLGTNKWDAILVYGVEPDHDIDIVEINNDYGEGIKEGGIHPTAKPVPLWEVMIKRFTNPHDLLFEPFTGTGVAFLACEKTRRLCYGLEIEPKYCSVALDRLERMGLVPHLVTDNAAARLG